MSVCPKCRHDSTNTFQPYCAEVIIERNVPVKQLSGEVVIEPEMPSFCACQDPWHKEK